MGFRHEFRGSSRESGGRRSGRAQGTGVHHGYGHGLPQLLEELGGWRRGREEGTDGEGERMGPGAVVGLRGKRENPRGMVMKMLLPHSEDAVEGTAGAATVSTFPSFCATGRG
jgi:hypothetical protein